ncbi:DUF3817 domain-containing protein [Lacinutrix undariae]
MFSIFKVFRVVALLEGISYILLLFIATPIKKFYEDDTYVKLLGMPHGLLFIAYVILALLLVKKLKWNAATTAIVLIASLLPFGTFYIDHKYLKPVA